MKFFTRPDGRRESSFEDGRCKVPSVGAVKSAECGMMPVGSGMVPLADPEFDLGVDKSFVGPYLTYFSYIYRTSL